MPGIHEVGSISLLSHMITQTQRSRHVHKSHTTSEGLGLGFALGSMAVGRSASPQRLGLVRNSLGAVGTLPGGHGKSSQVLRQDSDLIYCCFEHLVCS